jgi:ATP-dependent helicase Lhr and Lhr-like helicase
MAVLNLFHPAVAAWFAEHFLVPTNAQVEAWPAIRAGRDTLVAAPTGSGKTLAAFVRDSGGQRAVTLLIRLLKASDR